MNCNHCGKAVKLESIDISPVFDNNNKMIAPAFRPESMIAYCKKCGHWTTHRHNELRSLEDRA